MIGLNFGHNAATRCLLAAAPAALLFACGTAIADVTIVGAITNCDVTNTTPEVCDEMEIELEGPHASDVVYTWRNYNYGAPTITDLPGNTGVRVSYHAAGRVTQRNAVEHFGITLRDFSVLTRRTFRWKHNGVVVMAGPGANVQIPIPVTYIPPRSRARRHRGHRKREPRTGHVDPPLHPPHPRSCHARPAHER